MKPLTNYSTRNMNKCDQRELNTETAGIPILKHTSEDRVIVKPVSLVKYCNTKCDKFTDDDN